MFASLPQTFRVYGIHADVRTLLLLHKGMQKGLIKTLGDIYIFLKSIVVKDPKMTGPYTRAYYQYFLNIDIQNGETLQDAVSRSETFRRWRNDNIDRFGDDIEVDDIVNTFLDDVHLTNYDIKEILNGKELWDNDSGDVEDKDGIEGEGIPKRELNKMADYSNLSLEELLERMRQVLSKQKSEHGGGSHWIGTGGISPYGHGGAAKDGLRVGGSGGGKMARRVLGDQKYFPVDRDALLNDTNVDAALAALQGVMEESATEYLDVNVTIQEGLKRGGLFIPEIQNQLSKNLKVILLIDNGGYSMDPYIKIVQTLFRKMKTRYAHDLETYYFHNTIYDRLYSDPRRTRSVMLDSILKKNPDYRVFLIGDASMAPYEITQVSLSAYRALKKQFKKIAWLNPEPQRYWNQIWTVQVLKEMVDMYPLTPSGIEASVRDMNQKH